MSGHKFCAALALRAGVYPAQSIWPKEDQVIGRRVNCVQIKPSTSTTSVKKLKIKLEMVG